MRHALIYIFAATSLSAASLNFQAARSYFAGEPVCVFAGDFNGDGKQDIVSMSWGAPVQVLLSNGDGTFRAIEEGTVTEFTPEGCAVGDFDGDGKLDIAVASDSPGVITIAFGEGNGKFYTKMVNVPMQVYGLTAGDVNGDGILDLITVAVPGNGNQPFQLLLGKGNGTFEQAKSISNSVAGGVLPSLVDVNHDGKLDLVYLAEDEVVTQLGNGDGTFGPPQIFPLAGNAQALAIGDMNGDGNPDLVIAGFQDGSDVIIVALSQGDGTFTVGSVTPIAYLPNHLAVGDFNEDGHLDVIASGQPSAYTPAYLTVLLGDGAGSFSTRTPFPADRSGPMALADFNGDNHLDLAVANGQGGTVDITFGDGHGNFFGPLHPDAGPTPVSAAAADLNGDGKMDLAVVNEFYIEVHQVDILLGNGDGTFQPPTPIRVGVTPEAIAIADLNHDGIPDLVIADAGSPSGMYVLIGKGGGQFATPVYYSSPSASTLMLIDVNHDGVPDIVGMSESSYTPGVFVLLGKGDGTFQPSHGFLAGHLLAGMAAGDFNGDGNIDIVVSDRRGNAVLLLPGNGDGTFGSPVTLASMTAPIGIVAADFNGDGKLDIAVTASGQGEVIVLAGNGDGTFQLPAIFPVTNGGVNGLIAADFDGDGHLDLLASGHIGFQFTVLLGNGSGQFQSGGTFDAGGFPYTMIPADFNGDGLPDLAICNGNFASSAIYLTLILNTTN